MKPISFVITDEEKQIVKDLKYHNNITIKDIFLAGLQVLHHKFSVKTAQKD